MELTEILERIDNVMRDCLSSLQYECPPTGTVNRLRLFRGIKYELTISSSIGDPVWDGVQKEIRQLEEKIKFGDPINPRAEATEHDVSALEFFKAVKQRISPPPPSTD